jgi:integrase/recombinase XerD
MRKRRKHKRTKPLALTGVADPEGLLVWARRFCEQLRVKAYAEYTVASTESCLGLFIAWANERGIGRPGEVTKSMLESYQRHLFYLRKPSGKPLTYSSQRLRLQKVRLFFRWLARQNAIDSNPASDLELPRVERRLPKAVLSEAEVERALSMPDLSDIIGLRDRAMMEVFYSTGIRRAELAALEVFDLDHERGTLTVRLGKGRKDRTVPIGERAIHWIDRYLTNARAELVVEPDPGLLFLSERGERLEPMALTMLMRAYFKASGIGKHGACHIFRHTMATLMLEGGADVRIIQELLGHAELSTTAIYTRISIRHLKLAHDAAHAAAKLSGRLPLPPPASPEPVANREHLLEALAAEALEERDGA